MTDDLQAQQAVLFQLRGVGVVETDMATGRFVWANAAFCEIVGYSEAELQGMTNAELTHPDDWGGDAEQFAALQKGEIRDVEATTRVLRKDDSVAWLDLHITVLKDDAGKAVNLTVVTDVTERKRHEANLAFLAQTSADFAPLTSAEEIMQRVGGRLAEHLKLSRCHFAVVDEEADRVDVIYEWRRDETMRSLMGVGRISENLTEAGRRHYSAGKLSVMNGTQDSPLVNTPPEVMRELGFGSLVDVPHLQNGSWTFLLTVGRSEGGEWREDEQELIRELTARIYLRIERARAEESLQAFNETLEQRVLERTQELRHSEQRFSQAFYSNPIPACMTSFGQETFVEVNAAFLALTGYEHDEVVGHSSRELQMWSSPEDQQKIGKVQQDGKGFRELELRLRAKNEETRAILMSAAVIHLDGHEGYLKMFYDITERKQTEEQLHRAVQEVMSDAGWFSRKLMEQLAHIRSGGTTEPEVVELSKRERQVLERMARGMNNKAIATELDLKAQTVRNYITAIYEKLGVHSRVEAVVWARERGML